MKRKPVTLAEQFHNNDEGPEVKRYIIRRTRMFDDIETELKADCKKWGVVYIEPTSKEELPNKTKSRRQCLRRKMKALSSKLQVDVIEEQLKTDCEKWGVIYINPLCDETEIRRQSLIRRIKAFEHQAIQLVLKFNEIEDELNSYCNEWGVGYITPALNEMLHETKSRRHGMRVQIKCLKLQSYVNSDPFVVCDVVNKLVDEVDTCVAADTVQDFHSNPNVYTAAKDFEKGETLHSVATCDICLETRPVFHNTTNNNNRGMNLISFTPWKITKHGCCQRCHKDNLNRKKKNPISPANLFGCYSKQQHMAPATNIIRTNNMHFNEIPPHLKNLTTVEIALISKITVVINVHVLRYGMLASKGYCISLPQDIHKEIATNLPLLPEEVGIVIHKRTNSTNTFLHQYSVQRRVVEDALNGLCYGFPTGGTSTHSAGFS